MLVCHLAQEGERWSHCLAQRVEPTRADEGLWWEVVRENAKGPSLQI